MKQAWQPAWLRSLIQTVHSHLSEPSIPVFESLHQGDQYFIIFIQPGVFIVAPFGLTTWAAMKILPFILLTAASLHASDFQGWSARSPRDEIRPEFSTETDEKLVITHDKCHRSLQNVPPAVESKCTTPGRWFLSLGGLLLARTGRGVFEGGCKGSMPRLFPLEEGFGEPWFPDLHGR
jgi:hypothetical protein